MAGPPTIAHQSGKHVTSSRQGSPVRERRPAMPSSAPGSRRTIQSAAQWIAHLPVALDTAQSRECRGLCSWAYAECSFYWSSIDHSDVAQWARRAEV